MFTLIHDLPPHVVGVQATGVVGREDYEQVMLPAMADLYRRKGRVSLLLQLETELHNYTRGAWMEDAKLGMRYFNRWHRVAIVSRKPGIRWFTDTFGMLVPGEYKGFLMEDLVEAKRWVSA
jgi:hypothetical protein